MPPKDSHGEALQFHEAAQGKVHMAVTKPVESRSDLALTYTPGVAAPCEEIAKDVEKVWIYTGRRRRVAIVTDGSAVLGLGKIGPEAALPVMEGKAALLTQFAGLDAFPLCLATKSIEEFVTTVRALAPSVGGILLEDIAAPACFLIEEQLKEELTIPVMHDDQHGTAVVVLAGLMNALEVTGRMKNEQLLAGRSLGEGWRMKNGVMVSPSNHDTKIVISGAGAAGTAIARILLSQSFGNILVCDRKGIISRKRSDLDAFKGFLAAATNPENREGNLANAMKNADVFIGVSTGNIVSEDMVRSMTKDPIVFALANPTPEIPYEAAKRAGAAVVATGRSDFPNQVNNLLAFPGIFRGALDAHAKKITESMKRAAAEALASYVKEPNREQILPDPLDQGVVPAVAAAVTTSSSPTPPQRAKHQGE